MIRRLGIVALLALAASPAGANGVFTVDSLDGAVGDDLFPPGISMLPPDTRAAVMARRGKGLSLAGVYNDPSLALAMRDDGGYGYRRHGRFRPIVARH